MTFILEADGYYGNVFKHTKPHSVPTAVVATEDAAVEAAAPADEDELSEDAGSGDPDSDGRKLELVEGFFRTLVFFQPDPENVILEAMRWANVMLKLDTAIGIIAPGQPTWAVIDSFKEVATDMSRINKNTASGRLPSSYDSILVVNKKGTRKQPLSDFNVELHGISGRCRRLWRTVYLHVARREHVPARSAGEARQHPPA